MRDAFFRTITDLAAQDERVMFLTADLGFKLFDEFQARFPDRFLNMGVSEANMVSVAAGLALCGKRPFTYSITPFATIRCLEQIRHDVCGMAAPVTIVGVGGGYAYGANGASHHGIDDIAATRAMPGLTVVCPCDPRETTQAMATILAAGSPAYLRLGRAGETVLPGTDAPFVLGEPTVLSEGSDIVLAACGQIAEEALGAAALLKKHGITPHVLSVHTANNIQPAVQHILNRHISAVFTIEEHGPAGGISEALAGGLACVAHPIRVVPLTTPNHFVHDVGDQACLRRLAGLDAESIARTVVNTLEETL